MSIIFEKNGKQEAIMENVTLLEASNGEITVSTMFEEPKTIDAAYVKKIDFMGGKVILAPLGE